MDLQQALAFPRFKTIVDKTQELRESLQLSIKTFQESGNCPSHPIYQRQKVETNKIETALLKDIVHEKKIILRIGNRIKSDDLKRIELLETADQHRKKRPMGKKVCESSYLQGYYVGLGEFYNTELMVKTHNERAEAITLLQEEYNKVRSQAERLPLSNTEKKLIVELEKDQGIVKIDSEGNIKLWNWKIIQYAV